MAELNLKQIEDKLNSEFEGDGRKIVFWYDDKGEFIDEIETLNLENAKIHHLTLNNLFKTKLLIERQDKESNYLLYAPYPKPASRENHLADIIKYSKEFFADRASLLAVDLGIDEKYRYVLEKHINFFRAKDRTKRFYDLEVDNYDENSIEISLLSALVNSKVSNFEEVARIVLTNGDLRENEYIEDFKKYDLDTVFWKHVSHTFSFVDENPSLEKLLISLFLTYTEKEIHSELPKSMKKYILSKPGTVIAFMDQIMNSILYREEFDVLSEDIFASINGENLFKEYLVEDLIDLDLFEYIDKRIISWIIDRLLDENLNANVKGMHIPELCRFRENKHFGDRYFNEYHLLRHAYHILKNVNFEAEKDLILMIARYDSEDYIIDTHYRKFYYYLDKAKNSHLFDDLQVLVENVYTNKYLDVISKEFIEEFSYDKIKGRYKLQRDFYKNFVANRREMTVVIISDGLRYEVAKELVKKMKRDKKFDSVEIEPQIGVIPSYTRLGMASLLPHEELTIDGDFNVFVDGKACTNLVQRNEILNTYVENSASIQYDDLKKYNQKDLSDFFVGKELVYVYHDQIDARGDESTEDEVFIACKEAIEEIGELIIRLTNGVSRTNYIITADHGFIYKRNKTIESDKIDNLFSKEDKINKRYIVSENKYDVIGTKNLLVADILGTYDTKTVTVPISSNIFKTAGGGQNYVHGGSSPQEILVPVIQVKTNRGYRRSENVKISLISMLPKITSLSVNLDFIQQEAISDVIKPTNYRIFFIDDKEEIISNEEIHLANSKEIESAKRIFKLRFNLKDQKYDRYKKNYLVAKDAETGIEIFRHEVTMDIAFAGGFGFDI